MSLGYDSSEKPRLHFSWEGNGFSGENRFLEGIHDEAGGGVGGWGGDLLTKDLVGVIFQKEKAAPCH